MIQSVTIIVAVARLLSTLPVESILPPQQSPMFGHRASSQTVCSPNALKSFLILLYDAPEGIDVLRYAGSRGALELPSMTRLGGSADIKSSSEGPEASVCVNEDLEDEGVARQRTVAGIRGQRMTCLSIRFGMSFEET